MTPPGLRERKKARTRRQIQEAALRLITEQGYDATTVEQIAEASEISPSTFFRYFPTKEDVVVSDDYDPAILAAFAVVDPGDSPVHAFRTVAAQVFEQVYAAERDTLLQRVTLVFSTPALRARTLDGVREGAALYGRALAERYGRTPDDPQVTVAMAAIMATVSAAIEDWVAAGGVPHLPALIDDALALLEGGLVLRARQAPG